MTLIVGCPPQDLLALFIQASGISMDLGCPGPVLQTVQRTRTPGSEELLSGSPQGSPSVSEKTHRNQPRVPV